MGIFRKSTSEQRMVELLLNVSMNICGTGHRKLHGPPLEFYLQSYTSRLRFTYIHGPCPELYSRIGNARICIYRYMRYRLPFGGSDITATIIIPWNRECLDGIWRCIRN
ncbi:hypothetical protein PV325_005796 [Microctonus aethiopoides]|nr:hypothetical protein PV325_005796 [Microctonus aethiopoides]